MADSAGRPSLVQRLGLSLAALLALVLVAELGVRVFDGALDLAHPEDGLYAPHPFKGYGLRPRGDSPDRNLQGLRGREVSPHKAPGVVRVLCLGGSTTYGSGLDVRETYPARLAELLVPLATPERRHEVLNCGVPGYSTVESLIDLELRLLELEPDALVLCHGLDDARLVQARGFQPDYAHMRTTWRKPRLSAPEQWLWSHSYAYAWLARTAGFAPDAVRLEDLIYVEDYADLYEPAGETGVNLAGVDTFIRNIDSTVGLAQSHGLQVLLATFPMRGGADTPVAGQDFAPTILAMNRRLLEYAREHSVPLVDFAAALDQRRELFMDPIHLDAEGTAVQAELVLAAAQQAGLWGLAAR
jgi:lysophospholipase L1-like esterase